MRTDKTVHTTPISRRDKALVVVMRSKEADFGIRRGYKTPLAVDGEYVGVTIGGTYFFAYIQPGEHWFCSSMQGTPSPDLNASSLKINLQPGETYFLQQRPRAASGVGGVISALDRVSKEQADALLPTLALANATYEKGSSLIPAGK